LITHVRMFVAPEADLMNPNNPPAFTPVRPASNSPPADRMEQIKVLAICVGGYGYARSAGMDMNIRF
jgi:hypothetical protein